MKSFGIKRDEKDPRWAKFIEWCNTQNESLLWNGNSDFYHYYGLDVDGIWNNYNQESEFTRIITLDEWEAEFMNKLAGREYDEKLLNEFINKWINESQIPLGLYSKEYLNHRYTKHDRIAEIKEQIDKLSNELKELEK